MVRRYKRVLGLDGWVVGVGVVQNLGGDETPLMGQIEVQPLTMSAVLLVRRGLDDSDCERTVFHELLHILLSDMKQVSESLIDDIDPSAQGPLRELLHQSEERTALALERAVFGM